MYNVLVSALLIKHSSCLTISEGREVEGRRSVQLTLNDTAFIQLPAFDLTDACRMTRMRRERMTTMCQNSPKIIMPRS